MHFTPRPRWLMIASTATVVLPVVRSPMISWRWPRPIGVIASIALMPVASGSCPDFRGLTPGASGPAALCLDVAETVDRVPQRVDHAAQEVVAHRGREDLAGAPDRLALLDTGEVAEDDHTDLTGVEVQGEALGAVLELEELVGHRRGETADPRDAVTGLGDPADLFLAGGGGLVVLDVLLERVPDLFWTNRKLRHVLCLFPGFSGVSVVFGAAGDRGHQPASFRWASSSRLATGPSMTL